MSPARLEMANGGEATAERREMVALAGELAAGELLPRAMILDGGDAAAIDTAWGPIAEVGFDRALAPGAGEEGPALDPDTFLLCLEELGAGDAGIAVLVLLSNAAHVSGAIPDREAGGRWALVPLTACTPRPPRDGLPIHLEAIEPAVGALGADGIVVVIEGGRFGAEDDGVAAEGGAIVAGGGTTTVGAMTADSGDLEIAACRRALLGLGAARAARVTFAAGGFAEAGGEGANGRSGAQAALDLTRIGAGAVARGIARRAGEMAREYASQRVQGGVAIAEHDAVREMLARMAVREASTPMAGTRSAAAAIGAIEAAAASATDAVQVFGGAGYMCETGVEKLMRDAKVLELWPQPAWTLYDRLAAEGQVPRGG